MGLLTVRLLVLLVSLAASLLLRPAFAFEGKSKFGPNAVPVLEAMLRPAPAKHGALAGEIGGLVRIRPAASQ